MSATIMNSKPAWWTDYVEASWDKVKAEAIADWKAVVAGEQKVVGSIDENAIAFGHGARHAYHQLGSWSGEVEARLKADWKGTTSDVEQAWDRVSRAVQHGWERATGVSIRDAVTLKMAPVSTTKPE